MKKLSCRTHPISIIRSLDIIPGYEADHHDHRPRKSLWTSYAVQASSDTPFQFPVYVPDSARYWEINTQLRRTKNNMLHGLDTHVKEPTKRDIQHADIQSSLLSAFTSGGDGSSRPLIHSMYNRIVSTASSIVLRCEDCHQQSMQRLVPSFRGGKTFTIRISTMLWEAFDQVSSEVCGLLFEVCAYSLTTSTCDG